MGDIRFPIGPVFNHCRLNFKQCSFTHTARVSPSSNSLVCQFSMAFPICCFPPRLSAQGRLDDPGTFLLVPPGSARDTVMRDMAHNPKRAPQAFPTTNELAALFLLSSVSIPNGLHSPFRPTHSTPGPL